MTGRPLDVDLARVIVSDGPSSGSRLAQRIHARKADVLRELHTNSAFVCISGGRYARWNLRGTGQEPLHGHASAELVCALIREVAALQRRVETLEGQNGTSGSSRDW
jgi:hypothetical protein